MWRCSRSPASPLHKSPTLGLDLQGGLEVTLQAVPPPDRDLTEEDLDRSVDIMRNRVDKLGVSEPEIRTQGDDQIVIQLPGVENPEAAAEIIGTTAQLELYDLESSVTGPSVDIRGEPVEHASLYELLAKVQAQAQGDASDAYYIVNPTTQRVVSGPYASEEDALRRSGGELPAGRQLFAVPEGMVVVTCGEGAVVCPGGQGAGVTPEQTWYYLFEYDPPDVPQMTGEDLKLSGTRADFDTSPGSSGRPIVTMEFTGAGGDTFERLTRDLHIRGNLRNDRPQHFAIVLDREIKTFPQIDPTDSSLAGGISGGRAQIEGLDSFQEAKEIALVLQTGALPVKFETLDRTDISATLGQDSLEQAWRAAIGGLLLVVLFLLVLYRFLGVVAVIGLAIYAAFIYATILIFNVTLTLPGFAGLVLTFGVAADANIVIFERIKEEVRAGRSVRAAIATGYRKGFATIVDANVVTAITALVLFAVATAGVRGFALMLLIGTLLSLLTAVLATRAILALLGGFGWLDNPRFMGATGEGLPRWLRLDYIGRRRIWFAFSTVLVVLSIAAIGLKGLNLGIDFRGGTQITFTTPEPTGIDDCAQPGGGDRSSRRGHPGPRRLGRRQVHELHDPDGVADERGAEHAPAGARGLGRCLLVRGQERVRELRPADREQRAARDLREPPPDGRLHLDPLPVEVLGRRPRRARPRPPDRDRHLRTHRARGDDGDRGSTAHDPRLLDVRHHHHLRPHSREHPVDAAGLDARDRERLAVGDDPALARDDLHHAPATRLAVRVRRRHAQGLRLRPAHRDRSRLLLVDLPGRAAARRAQAARARLPAPARRPRRSHRCHDGGRHARGRGRGDRRLGGCDGAGSDGADGAGADAAPQPSPVGAPSAGQTSKRERRRQRRASRPHGRAR